MSIALGVPATLAVMVATISRLCCLSQLLLWDEFNNYGIPIQTFDDVITCYYNASEGTASREADMAKRQRLWEKYTKLKDQIPSIKV